MRFTMAVRTGNEAVAKVIDMIEEAAWTPIEYTDGVLAEVAETTYRQRRPGRPPDAPSRFGPEALAPQSTRLKLAPERGLLSSRLKATFKNKTVVSSSPAVLMLS